MTTLYRVRCPVTVANASPGVMTLYALDLDTFRTDLGDMLNAIAGYMPIGSSMTVETTGDTIEDTTGDLNGAWSGAGVSYGAGSYSGQYAAGVGAQIEWKTATILDARRLRGRSYVVPLGTGAFDSVGTLSTTVASALQAESSAFVNAQSSSFVIWHRPYPGREATADLPAKAAHAGGHGLVTASSVPDKVAILRSRRD